MAMAERTGGSGNASSLLGLFQFILGGLISPLVGLNGQHDMSPYLLLLVLQLFYLLHYKLFISNYL